MDTLTNPMKTSGENQIPVPQEPVGLTYCQEVPLSVLFDILIFDLRIIWAYAYMNSKVLNRFIKQHCYLATAIEELKL
jgi:hypothetical protein